jgi:glycopeptide antibiotics resistance protein
MPVRPSDPRGRWRSTRLLRALFVAYLIPVLALTLWPRITSTLIPEWATFILDRLGTVGVAMSFDLLEALANVALFVPFGLLGVPLLTGRPRARAAVLTIAAGTALSVAIELAQLVIPGRFSSVQDVVMNGLGTILGATIAVVVLGYRRGATGSGHTNG